MKYSVKISIIKIDLYYFLIVVYIRTQITNKLAVKLALLHFSLN